LASSKASPDSTSRRLASARSARRGLLQRQLQQLGHQLQAEGGADHRRRAQQRVDVLAGPAHLGQHRVLQGGRVPAALQVVAGADGPHGRQREQRVAAGLGVHALGQLAHAQTLGQLGDGLRRQRPERDGPHPVEGAEHLADLAPLAAAHGRHHQQPAAGQPAQQEVQQLQRGGPGLVQVVQQQQHRLLARQAGEQGGQRLEGAAPLQLGRGALVGWQVEQVAQLGHQLGNRPGRLPGRGGDPLGWQRQQHGAQRLDQRLQEQRALGLVAARLRDQAAGGAGEDGQLLRQAGLADAALPRHQDQPVVLPDRRRPGRAQRRQLGVAPDQRALRHPGDGADRRRQLGRLAAQDPQVQLPGGRSRVGAELIGEQLAQVLVGGQGRALLASAAVGEHGRPVALLVERLGDQGGARVPQGGGAVAKRQRGAPGGAAGPAGEALPLAPGVLRPVRAELVGQHRPAAEHGDGALRGGHGERRLLQAQAGLGLADQALRLVQVHADVGAGGKAPALPVAGDGISSEHRAQAADEGCELFSPNLRGLG
jgi:hypothetical protein